MSSTNSDFYRDELTETQILGINLLINAIKKKFPFIVDWKLSNDYEEYVHTLYLYLYIDPKKLGEYFNKEVNEYLEKTPYLSFFLRWEDEYGINKVKELESIVRPVQEKIFETMNNLHEVFPEQYQIYTYSKEFPNKYRYLVNFNVDWFFKKD